MIYSFPNIESKIKKIILLLVMMIMAISCQSIVPNYKWYSTKELVEKSDKLKPGDEIIENRLSQVTFSALGQMAGTEEKYAWDPDCRKREKIVARAKELASNFMVEIGGTTSINAVKPGMNKAFGMTHLMEELGALREDILYFGDMTQPGGNDYPVLEMGIETITVRNHKDTEYALRGILGVL